MNEITLDELVQARDQGQLVLFIGADLPADVTNLPSRRDVARVLATRHSLDATGSLAQIASLIQTGAYRRDLIDAILDAYDAAQPGHFHKGVVWMAQTFNLRHIVTTTYDLSLERAFTEANIDYTTIVDNTDLEFIDPESVAIYRLYGHVQRKDRLVITEDDQAQLLADPQRSRLISAVEQLFRQNTGLFYGYNLHDLDFTFLLAGRSGQTLVRRAFAVWPTCSEQERRLWERRQVIVLTFDPFGLTEAPEMAVIGDREVKGAPTRGGEQLEEISPLPPPPEAELRLDTLRIDAAAPEHVTLDQSFVLAVAVRQPTSPPLQESDLDTVHSGEAQVFVSSDQPFVTLRLEVSAPGCDIDGAATRQFRLPLGHDSPIFYFNLIPRQSGTLNIIIQLYQEDNWLGSTRLHTLAAEAPAGEVRVQVTSDDIAPPAHDRQQRIDSLQRQLDDAQLLLAMIDEQLAAYPAGEQPPHLLLQKRKQEDAIRALEMALDSLMDADSEHSP